MPPAYTLDQGEIVADSGDVTARVRVDCASPSALVVRGSDVFVACGDERLTFTTAADVMRPVLVDRERMTCLELDRLGACRTPAEIAIVEPLTPSLVTRPERRTTLGGIIIVLSLGAAVVLEGSALMARIAIGFCDSQCGESNAPMVFDIASVIAAVGGTIAGIAVAATWHNVPRRTVQVLPLGLRVVF